MPTIFVLGITGYIGGSVANGLRGVFPDHEFVALVRSQKNNFAVEALGVKVLQGSHSDHKLITDQAAKSDIIVNCADADDLELTKAILSGAKSTTIGKTPILIHTSGTGLVTGEANGSFDPNAKTYNDDDPADIRGISPDAPHRNVDLEIFAADDAGYVSAYIIAPSTIYGTGDSPVNRLSQQVPGLIQAALENKQAVYVGEGTNVWNNVHIADLVDLYIIVTKLATSELGPAAKVDSYHKFFWGSAGKHVWGDVAREIGKALKAKGLVETAEAKSVPPSPALMFMANNSLTVANRSFKNGWSPKGPSLVETIPETIDLVVANQNK
ncbi:SubName: Full=Uncharacterized protein {ECO:0000313/EMBL:CCA70316.1} [Serendipita indica DSM 11827]|nr:SubName: Full=Uncharacterized protein {ECO:0000313/EMBL:CCA70316.1} [Serendipita indica DSM 11827]